MVRGFALRDQIVIMSSSISMAGMAKKNVRILGTKQLSTSNFNRGAKQPVVLETLFWPFETSAAFPVKDTARFLLCFSSVYSLATKYRKMRDK